MSALTTNSAEVLARLQGLESGLEGELRTDKMHRLLYAQDASVYTMEPLGVAFPRSREDIQNIVRLADSSGFSVVPRAAGTSLAGQTLGPGLVVDTGRHMNQILELNVEERWVRVQPGVILEDLNRYLEPHGLFFGPDTSTANRCMIGGMIGNNSCGTHSILYGNTMQHVLELGVVFSDGTYELLRPWDSDEFAEALQRKDRLGEGLRAIDAIVRKHGETIVDGYPRADVIRRNTGYPLDDIERRRPYSDHGEPFSLARFLCGTEGTLGITTEAKLSLVDAPRERLVVCAHFASLTEAMKATVLAIKHNPSAVELVDKTILDQTKNNLEQERNRFFVEGDPEGVLIIEFYRDTVDELEAAAAEVTDELRSAGVGYSYPIIRPPDDKKVWNLRKAGLGLLMGVPGDKKAVSVVEDTAVPVEDLPDYIAEFMQLMDKYGTSSVYHAHASVGELHLRPELNLRDPEDVEKFKGIARDTTDLVRTYRGSLSGEHGDGRVRSPLIERFYGEEIYGFHREIKTAFDPQNVFNPGVIVDPEPMDSNFRAPVGTEPPDVEKTHFDWSRDRGLLRSVEKCNGAGVCRKRAEAGGTMCPSYMVTLEEKDSTRGRANVFRGLLLEGPDEAMKSEVLKDALDLCLSCKGCKSECPANVDMARMKAEFTQHYHDHHGRPLSAWFFGNYARLSKLAAIVPALSNFVMRFGPTRALFNWLLNLAPQRSLPAYKRPFRRQARGLLGSGNDADETVWLYVDPFTEYTEPELAIDAIRVLEALGFAVERLPIEDDGRTYISKGMLREAAKLTTQNLRTLEPLFAEHPERVILGIEPSALLTFRDESPDLVHEEWAEVARDLASRSLLIDEFLDARLQGLSLDGFDTSSQPLVLHGHCHQKAMIGTGPTARVLQAFGYDVEVLPTGCCGMAGSFGYEADHYELSMSVGELVLFPRLRDTDNQVHIAAPGTSCRHQIADGVEREARHPISLLARRIQ